MADEPASPIDQEVSACPTCTEVFSGRTRKLLLGQHRRKEHGILGAKAQARANRGDGEAKTPKQPRGAPSGAGSPKQPSANVAVSDAELKAGVLEIYMLTSMVTKRRLPEVSSAVDEIATKAATEWVRYANRNPEFRKRLESVTSISYIPLVLAHLPLIDAVRDAYVKPMMDKRAARMGRTSPAAGGNGHVDRAASHFDEEVGRVTHGAPSE